MIRKVTDYIEAGGWVYVTAVTDERVMHLRFPAVDPTDEVYEVDTEALDSETAALWAEIDEHVMREVLCATV